MLRGDRGIFLAIGIVFAAVIGLGGSTILLSLATQEEASVNKEFQAKASAYANRAKVGIERRCRALPPQSHFQCVREENQAARDGRHNESDLKAQRLTAIWTRYMGIAAIAGTGFGIIGIALILATFRENKRAADTAQNNFAAYQHAERGFVHIDGAKVIDAMGLQESGPSILLTISNPGRSGARITKLHGGFCKDIEVWGWDEENQFTNIRPIYCKPEETLQVFCARIRPDPTLVICMGAIEYDTLGMTGRKSHFAYALIRSREDKIPALSRMETVKAIPPDT